ncbi:unnamed protein product, partial [Nesidiocoris tenuis]
MFVSARPTNLLKLQLRGPTANLKALRPPSSGVPKHAASNVIVGNPAVCGLEI